MEKPTITRKQLAAWNKAKNRLGGISFNEAWNEAQGLPNAAWRKSLAWIHADKYGISEPAGTVTMADVEAYWNKARELIEAAAKV